MPAIDPAEIDEKLVARVVASVLRDLSGPAAVPDRDPEYMSDPEIRRRLFGNMPRSTYWALTRKDGDFPPAVLVGATKLRRVADIRAWLAARAVD
jgi:hypothetical protein